MGNHHIDCDYCHRDTRGLGAVNGCYSRDEADKCWNYNPPAPCDEQPSAEDTSVAEPRRGASAVPEGQAPDRIKALLTQVETLTRENDYLRKMNHVESQRWLTEQLRSAEAERDALRTQLRAAHKALEPFARVMDYRDKRVAEAASKGITMFNEDLDVAEVCLVHLRSARSLLHTEKTEGSDER